MSLGARQIGVALGLPQATPKPARRRGRPPIHLSASLNLVLPSQLFPEFPGEGAASGEKRLMLAVLQDAIGIVLKHWRRTDARSRRLYAETVDWIVCDAVESPFAFVNVCETLGLEPSCLRRGLARRLTPDRPPDARPRPHPVPHDGVDRHPVI